MKILFAAILLSIFFNCSHNSKKKLIQINSLRIFSLKTAFERYFRDYRSYPRSIENTCPEVIDNLIKLDYFHHSPKNAYDYWGNPIKFILKKGTLLVYSFGPNKIDNNGRKDDISNITLKYEIKKKKIIKKWIVVGVIILAVILIIIFLILQQKNKK
jgi:hypothetical protein